MQSAPSPRIESILIETIHGASTLMLDMVNEVLHVATIESGELKLNRGKHDLAELVSKAVALINREAGKKGTQIVFEHPPGPVKRKSIPPK